MTTMLMLVIVLVLTAWLGSLVVQLEREVTKARRRGVAARDKESKLGVMIENMLVEEKTLTQQIVDQEHTNADLQKRVDMVRAELKAREAGGRPRLLVLHPRRHPGDKDWIVTLANPNVLRVDSAQPLAQEWATGRDYLVFARTEHDARDRALRRFSSRPGMVVKASAAAPPNIFTTAPPGANA